MTALVPNALDPKHPVFDCLRRYLDEVSFTRVHQFVVSPQRYFSSLWPTISLDPVVQDIPSLALAATLMADRPCPRASLSGLAAEAAGLLLDAGLLVEVEGQLRLASLQLVSMQGIPLFIDADSMRAGAPTIPVPGLGLHSPLLAHHIDVDRISRSEPSLDLATGAGMRALFLSRHAPRVVATDEVPERLRLAALNLTLNRRAAVVELRGESVGAVLARPGNERYAVVTCDPRATLFPDGIEGPLYAPDAGGKVDGLGPLRQLLTGVDGLLLPHGAAYLAADLVGDETRPYFLAELERLVSDHGLCADAYLEDRVDYRIQLSPLRGLANLVARERGWDRQRVFELVKQHHLVGLQAQSRFLTVLVLRPRGAAQARLRVHNRYQLKLESFQNSATSRRIDSSGDV